MFNNSSDYGNFSDQELISLLKGSLDAQAFRILYDRYAAFLYNAALKRLPVPHKAEDLVQEVFISLYRNRTDLIEIRDLKGWLFACLRNRIINEVRDLRSHERHHLKIGRESTLSAVFQSEYDLKALEASFHTALASLTDRCREAFLLSRVEELPNKKIAEKMDVSVKSVEKHITNALRALRRKLSDGEIGVVILCASTLL